MKQPWLKPEMTLEARCFALAAVARLELCRMIVCPVMAGQQTPIAQQWGRRSSRAPQVRQDSATMPCASGASAGLVGAACQPVLLYATL
jgi:hypothetical protein